MRGALVCLALAIAPGGSAETARAQAPSADSLFQEASHDFGTVARGAKLRHSFWLVNNSSYDVRILSWKPKCGCTDVKPGAREIPPGTQTPIEATLDTTNFQNRKDSGLTLSLSIGDSYVEKDLNLVCFIRGDVRLSPGMADFNVVARGSSPSVLLTVNYYGGVPGWEIKGAETITNKVEAKVTGPIALQGGGVQYQITAKLNPKAPAGYLKDEINLITNDPQARAIPISVVANIQAAVTVQPGNLVLGRVRAGETVSKDVLVRSAKPFKITGTTSAKAELSAANLGGDAEGVLQRLKVTLKAPSQPGAYNAVMEITTSLKDEPPAKLTAYATVVP